MTVPTWLITGASNGFGQAIALEVLARGHHVLATARKTNSLIDLQNAGASTHELDVTWYLPRIQQAISSMLTDTNRIDILVNAAGYLLEGALEETSPSETLSQFTTNLFGTMNITRAILPTMRSQNSGIIANFGSIGSWRGGAGISNYNTTKWAVSGLSESLDVELRPLGIACVVIEPGYFATRLLSPGGSRTAARVVIDEYTESMAGVVRKKLNEIDGRQRGDVKKAAKIIVDVLTGTGVAEGRDVPGRLVLGQDCVDAVRAKCESTLELLKEWEDVVTKTDR